MSWKKCSLNQKTTILNLIPKFGFDEAIIKYWIKHYPIHVVALIFTNCKERSSCLDFYEEINQLKKNNGSDFHKIVIFNGFLSK